MYYYNINFQGYCCDNELFDPGHFETKEIRKP